MRSRLSFSICLMRKGEERTPVFHIVQLLYRQYLLPLMVSISFPSWAQLHKVRTVIRLDNVTH